MYNTLSFVIWYCVTVLSTCKQISNSGTQEIVRVVCSKLSMNA